MRSDEREMRCPVRCVGSGGCGRVFDLCAVETVARYSDRTVFITPCCGRKTDDRPLGWGGGVERVTEDEARYAASPDGTLRREF